MNQTELIQAVSDLLDSADNEGCSEDLTVVSAEPITKLKGLLERHHLYAKRDERGPYEDHRQEVGNMGVGDMHVIRWSCDFETRIKVDPGALEEVVRSLGHEIDVPEGTAIFVDGTFDIKEIDPEEE